MKKTIAIVLVLTLILCTSFAQRKRFEISLHGGPGLGMMFNTKSTAYKQEYKPTLVHMIGFGFQYNCKKVLSVRTELNYGTSGSQLNYKVTDEQGNPRPDRIERDRSTLIGLTVMPRISIGKKVKFIANVGAFINFVAAERKYFNQSQVMIDGSVINSYSVYNFRTKLDAGINAGAGISIPIKHIVAISLEARNNHSFTNAMNKNNVANANFNTTYFIVGVSYMFGNR